MSEPTGKSGQVRMVVDGRPQWVDPPPDPIDARIVAAIREDRRRLAGRLRGYAVGTRSNDVAQALYDIATALEADE